MIDLFIQDLRYAARSLVKQRAFAAAAISTLALGIGANTAIFSVISGVILRPLPFPHPERLVQVYGTSALVPRHDAVANLTILRNESTSLEALAGYEVSARYLRGTAGAERVMTVRVEQDFFPMLGIAPLGGRTFGHGDSAAVAVISEGFWNRRFQRDPAAIGRTLDLDGELFSIVGVMPGSFQFPYSAGSLLPGVGGQDKTDLWIPLDPPLGPRSRISQVTGRLKSGVSLAAAESELATIARRLETQYPGTSRGRSVRLEPLSTVVVAPPVRRVLFALFVAVGIVLALGCANVVNLSLARLTLRSREVAVRSALGASRSRLVRQFVTESLLVSFAGGTVGLALAWWGTSPLITVAEVHLPRVYEVGVDWRVFVFLLVACTVTGALLGTAPALVAARKDPRTLLQSGAQSTAPIGQRHLHNALVVAEVALAFVLAVSATVLIRELVRLRTTDPGMSIDNVVTFHIGHRMTPQTDTRQFYEIADRVARLPGVRAAGFAQMLPLQSWGWFSNSSDFTVRGRAPQLPVFPIELRYVTPGYFQALGIPIRRGRGFTARDDRNAPRVILINETLARQYFRDEDPLGKETSRGHIVGVVGDVRQVHLDRGTLPEIYYPIAQNWSQVSELGMTLIVSARGRPEPLINAVRAAVQDVNPAQAIFNVKTMAQVVADSLWDFTLYLSLMTAFAALAIVLASIGTYGVISYISTSRTKEFAIRAALGADRARVLRFIVGEGFVVTAIGVGVGILAVLAATPLLRDLPVTIHPPDIVTLVGIAIVIGTVALVACIVPARRAAAVDPMLALRAE